MKKCQHAVERKKHISLFLQFSIEKKTARGIISLGVDYIIIKEGVDYEQVKKTQ